MRGAVGAALVPVNRLELSAALAAPSRGTVPPALEIGPALFRAESGLGGTGLKALAAALALQLLWERLHDPPLSCPGPLRGLLGFRRGIDPSGGGGAPAAAISARIIGPGLNEGRAALEALARLAGLGVGGPGGVPLALA